MGLPEQPHGAVSGRHGRLVDLHAHVLPGIDDGPETIEQSLLLLRAMADQGIATVVTAAHGLDGRYNATRDAVLRATDQLNEALPQHGIPVQVIPGMELVLGFDLLRALKTNHVMGIHDTPYLVVELPANDFPFYTERALFELMMAGYRPILNHPERNRAIQRNPDHFYRLAEQGVPAMITAASLLGGFGARAADLGTEFLREGAADLVVSDAHDLERRAPLLPDGLALARNLGKADQNAEWAIIG